MSNINDIFKDTFLEKAIHDIQDFVERNQQECPEDLPDLFDLYRKRDFSNLFSGFSHIKKNLHTYLQDTPDRNRRFLLIDAHLMILDRIARENEYASMFFMKRRFEQEKLIRESNAKAKAMQDQYDQASQEASKITLEYTVSQGELNKLTAELEKLQGEYASLQDNADSCGDLSTREDLQKDLETLSNKITEQESAINELKIVKMPKLAAMKRDAEETKNFCYINLLDANRSATSAMKAIGERKKLNPIQSQLLNSQCAAGVARTHAPLIASEDEEFFHTIRDNLVHCWENCLFDKMNILLDQATEKPVEYPDEQENEENLLRVLHELSGLIKETQDRIENMKNSPEWKYVSDPSLWGSYFQKLNSMFM
ncbi:coiled-coil domain-containing protein [Succinimonas amylolytica]|uniref:coiled-coil domain-containing protein n=1 Tax=Succinimonas amylolytica TaxID=83769 RepID=UPI00036771B5|nr:hypothetical protein [Succinimonas amylolytica]